MRPNPEDVLPPGLDAYEGQLRPKTIKPAEELPASTRGRWGVDTAGPNSSRARRASDPEPGEANEAGPERPSIVKASSGSHCADTASGRRAS